MVSATKSAVSELAKAASSAAKRPSAASLSPVEQAALAASGYELIYHPDKSEGLPREHIATIVVDNFPMLGRLTAVRFLEWIGANPTGVVSLPTGKTPEYFIKYVGHYLKNWDRADIRTELEGMGLQLSRKPEMSGLRFVQIDEFYPIDTRQHNSFFSYVNKYYIKGFGLDARQAMLINPNEIGVPRGVKLIDLYPEMTVDLSLRIRKARSLLEKRQQEVLRAVDQFCTDYERKIREMGGIGFFLGGIGPDGHVAFNIKGSDFYSTTRLIEPNYETRAAAATDLGGMEVARSKHVITIGLNTITHNPQCVAIIIAAGEAKAEMVSSTLHSERTNEFPGSALQALPNARFYLTHGAAVQLTNRRFVDFQRQETVAPQQVLRVVMDLSLRTGKPLLRLTRDDFNNDRFGAELLLKTQHAPEQLAQDTHNRVVENLKHGNKPIGHKRFLHTAPHHDDIILAYLPYVTNLVRRSSTIHAFAYMTSGFNAVTNGYMHGIINDLLMRLNRGDFARLMEGGYFDPHNTLAMRIDISYYLQGAERRHEDKKQEAIARRLLRNMFALYEDDNVENIKQRCAELLNYFHTQYPGKKDMALVQQLKGRVREFESELKWASYGFVGESVRHLRLGFYKGDLFTEIPRVDRDVPPILNLVTETRPDIVTVAFDPEGSGPDTHYKVLQAVAEALKIYERESGRHDLTVIGYRNVWFKFHPSEANLYVPTSSTHLADMEACFDTCFNTQRTASFPSYEMDGPFSHLARKIQVKQFEQIRTLLGEEFFVQNEDHGMRACRGIVYLREMHLADFYNSAQALRHVAEAL